MPLVLLPSPCALSFFIPASHSIIFLLLRMKNICNQFLNFSCLLLAADFVRNRKVAKRRFWAILLRIPSVQGVINTWQSNQQGLQRADCVTCHSEENASFVKVYWKHFQLSWGEQPPLPDPSSPHPILREDEKELPRVWRWSELLLWGCLKSPHCPHWGVWGSSATRVKMLFLCPASPSACGFPLLWNDCWCCCVHWMCLSLQGQAWSFGHTWSCWAPCAFWGFTPHRASRSRDPPTSLANASYTLPYHFNGVTVI